MGRLITVFKNEPPTIGKGRERVVLRIKLDPILPDEMERITNVARIISGTKIDWYMENGKYNVYVLSYDKDADAELAVKADEIEEAARESWEWIEPVYTAAAQKAAKIGLQFQQLGSGE